MYLAVLMVCSVLECALAADGGGEADQQLIRDGVVVNRRKLCISALCWDNKI